MKVFVYSYREFDEAEWFTHFSKEYGIELGTSPTPRLLKMPALQKAMNISVLSPPRLTPCWSRDSTT